MTDDCSRYVGSYPRPPTSVGKRNDDTIADTCLPCVVRIGKTPGFARQGLLLPSVRAR